MARNTQPCVHSIAVGTVLALWCPWGASGIGATAFADFVGVNWDGDTVSIDAMTGTGSLIGPSGFRSLNSLAKDSNGRLVTAWDSREGAPRLVEVDSESGEGTIFHVPFLNSIRALAFSPGDVLFAIDGASTQSHLYRLDLSVPFGDSGIKIFIGQSSIGRIQGMTFAEDGTMYAWSTSQGLLTLDFLTAEATNVNGEFDGSSEIQSLAFGPEGRLYGIADALYEIDPKSGLLTLIGSGGYSSVRGFEWVVALSCPADIDGTGDVGFSDLLAVLSAWGPCKECPEDVDGSGTVDFGDLLIVLSEWGPCP